jgi:hypothetical protein
MSFKEITSDTAICNRALGMVSESKTISSLDDPGINAQACRRWYKPIVARLLEMHHWGLATKKEPLVAVTNGRATEWMYAYDAPHDLAFPVGISMESGASSVSYYRGLAGLVAMAYGRPIFLYQSGVIYSNMAGDLEYVSYDITEADFNATFENIVILMLASRLALELPKDMDLSKELAQSAVTEINIAMAQNLNAGNRQYGMNVSEAEIARGSALSGYNWDYFPLGPGA